MMNGQLNKLQVYEGRMFSDLINEPKLADMWALQPEKINKVLSLHFGETDTVWQSALDYLTGEHNLPGISATI